MEKKVVNSKTDIERTNTNSSNNKNDIDDIRYVVTYVSDIDRVLFILYELLPGNRRTPGQSEQQKEEGGEGKRDEDQQDRGKF